MGLRRLPVFVICVIRNQKLSRLLMAPFRKMSILLCNKSRNVSFHIISHTAFSSITSYVIRYKFYVNFILQLQLVNDVQPKRCDSMETTCSWLDRPCFFNLCLELSVLNSFHCNLSIVGECLNQTCIVSRERYNYNVQYIVQHTAN